MNKYDLSSLRARKGTLKYTGSEGPCDFEFRLEKLAYSQETKTMRESLGGGT